MNINQLTFFLPPILLLISIIVLVRVLSHRQRRGSSTPNPTSRHYYVDTDLRLTYAQYMKFHPDSNFTYAEYKRAQAQRAYTKAGTSRDLKRMVR